MLPPKLQLSLIIMHASCIAQLCCTGVQAADTSSIYAADDDNDMETT